MSYPKREPFYAHRLTRLLFKSCAAQSIGQDAVLLIIHIAHTEDAARYQGPVRFWNSQLNETLGFCSPKSLNNARAKAVEAGWLQYQRKNIKAVGEYFTVIPPSVSKFTDEPIEQDDSFQVRNESISIHSKYGTNPGMNPGTNPGMNDDLLSNPVPVPKKVNASLVFSDEDIQTANWMFKLIQGINPGHKTPSFEKWASDIRLMRERDSRSDPEIRRLFAAANRDSFWQKNILSPGKLREKWDKLVIVLQVVSSATGNEPKREKTVYPRPARSAS